MLYTSTGTLTPRAPFDFAKTYAFLQGFSPTEGEQALAHGAITKAITVNGRCVSIDIHSSPGERLVLSVWPVSLSTEPFPSINGNQSASINCQI